MLVRGQRTLFFLPRKKRLIWFVFASLLFLPWPGHVVLMLFGEQEHFRVCLQKAENKTWSSVGKQERERERDYLQYFKPRKFYITNSSKMKALIWNACTCCFPLQGKKTCCENASFPFLQFYTYLCILVFAKSCYLTLKQYCPLWRVIKQKISR